MQKVIIPNIEIAYLENRYPNKYVVRVSIEDNRALKTILNIFYGLGFSDEESADAIHNHGVFFVCEDGDEAYDIFDLFDIEYAPYVYIWGPIELIEITPDMDAEMIEEVNRENQIQKEFICKHPDGMILHDNLN